MNDVQGHSPACGSASLFLGEGGYITCSWIDCPEPDAASTLLERDPRKPEHAYAGFGELCLQSAVPRHCGQPKAAHDAYIAGLRNRTPTPAPSDPGSGT